MGCFKFSSSSKATTKQDTIINNNNNNNSSQTELKNLKHQVLLQIPGCCAYLMEEGEAVELAKGEFELVQISDDNTCLATTIKVGDDLQWPLTKDEPVVKLDPFHYLFSLPIRNGDPLSYGVTFSQQQQSSNSLGLLDQFLRDHSCFSVSSSSSSSGYGGKRNNNGVDWKEFAPRIEDYNGVLARAIAGGTGQIVRGIFIVSNAYTNQIQKGGETILTGPAHEQDSGRVRESNGSNKNMNDKKKSQLNKSLKRVKMMSKMTEKISKSMLDGVGIVTGSVMKPVVRSQAGKAFLSMVPGEVLLASLDAVNKIFDAAEVAEKQAFGATSSAATRMVSNRYGESAGEATGDALATAGHCANTAWNIFKIRKAINPASTVSSGFRTAALNTNPKS